jgi:dihydrofolate reductase
MKAIIAVNKNNWIGIGNRMLWHCPDDLIHFKKLTQGSTCLVGYRTYTGLPALPNRKLVVDTPYEVNLVPDWCIGGKKTYEKYAPHFTELHISHINNDSIGDVAYPVLSELNPECQIFHYYFENCI